MVDFGLERRKSGVDFVHAISADHHIESGVSLIRTKVGLGVRILA